MKDHLHALMTVLVFGFLAVAGLTGCTGQASEDSGSGAQTEQQEHGHSHGEEGHGHSHENGHQH